ncbi:Hypothetical Cytosolic Protein [Bacillus pseudomycoides]|uniref:hypothetical protein n=1 Tax=Bacillus pseudomycoides TaxID=64104 RepID=UPI0001A13350|nr:hypothetical protein [Bacillus pseudomycoides]EEM08291.1 Hypothetical Cytosolic Protein [Bacillus pseudomycoides]
MYDDSRNKVVKRIKVTTNLGLLAKLRTGETSFNPNIVQSLRDNKNIALDRVRLAGLKAEKYGNEKMYQLGGKMTQGMENTLAFFNKGHEIVGDGVVAGKQGGPGKVTEWVNTRHAESSKKINDEIQGIEASLAKGTGDAKFTYKNNPMDNPKAVKDILENPDAVYGFSPNPDSTRIGKYANKIDWSDSDQVEIAKQTRQAYHEANEKMLDNLYSQGYSTEDIARKMVNERNANRLNSYIEKGDMEGYELVRKSNLQTYNNADGPTPESFFEKYGSWEGVVNASVSSNPGMDACVGLYDIYHGGKLK